ncbi:MAG: 50S ribosomal protein L19 [Candidatus Omnitrophica bacterium]|nr:50S ribosomal protein L19 [Candidatus Omnitrophota bacterium]
MTGKLFEVEREFKESLKKDYPQFRVGDTVKVTYKIKEKEKSRLHSIEGIIIKKQGAMHRQSFTIRRISYGKGMEVTFPLYSPVLDAIEVVQEYKKRPRRSRLYYLRKRVGRRATEV